MTSAREMLDMNMEDILNMSDRHNWDLATLEVWSTFKIAQYLEKIAHEKGG